MAQNQLNDLMEERVYPLVTSIKGFFGSFGWVLGLFQEWINPVNVVA